MSTRSLKLFGRNVASTYHHLIMSLEFDRIKQQANELTAYLVTSKPDEIMDGVYSSDVARRILRDNEGLCDILNYLNNGGETVGTVSVMYKGGNEIEYRIRGIEAFIYNVFTCEQHRGKGYAGDMIRMLMAYLHNMGVDKAYLAVSTNNAPAIRAYEKSGFIVERELYFLRILRVNIPYRSL